MATIDLDKSDEAALLLMCEQHWQEGQTLDFKRELPGSNDKGKSEIRKDVCAFANADGGLIAYGVDDKDGYADKLTPITSEGADAAVLRLGQVIDGIEPRLRGWRLQPVTVTGGYVLLLKVPKSFDGPHRYLVNDASRFVMRSGRHTADLSYQQLRSAFGTTDTLLERARTFRDERLKNLPKIGTPLPMSPGPITAIHVIPLEAMAGRSSIDVLRLYYDYSPMTFNDWGGGSRLLNLDGLLAHAGSKEFTNAFSRLFRSGVVEFGRYSGLSFKEEEKTIPSLTIARFMRDAIPKAADIMRRFDISGPGIVGFAMLRIGAYHLAISNHGIASSPDRSDLIFPEAWVDDVASMPDADAIVKPVLDLLWQAYGEPVCRLYDKDGKWVAKD